MSHHGLLPSRTRGVLLALVAAALTQGVMGRIHAQGGRGQPAAPTTTPKAAAPIDLTGYWVSIVTQDWRWRMVTPAKGDYVNIPMTIEAKKVADAWDPAKDEAAGEQCRSYGAPALMSVPGRVRISWQDDSALKVETDAGMQTRSLHFGDWKAPRNAPSTWQGNSVAVWETPRANATNASLLLRPVSRTAGAGPARSPAGGSLKVVTTGLRSGYLRKNGVPYSANAVLTEYWDLFKWRNGEEWLTITTQTEDPMYLREPQRCRLAVQEGTNRREMGSDALLITMVNAGLHSHFRFVRSVRLQPDDWIGVS